MRSPLLRNGGLWLLMVAIFGVSFTISAAQVAPRTEATPTNIVAQRNFGSWRYSAIKENGGIMIAVELTQKNHKAFGLICRRMQSLLRAYFNSTTP
ncbi:MAG: hypothetical protein ACJ8CR_05560 [Roseiflexaceae bacterium]